MVSTSSNSSTPLNLRNLSINETREASVSQIDEIWKQVETAGEGEGLDGSSGSGSPEKADDGRLKVRL